MLGRVSPYNENAFGLVLRRLRKKAGLSQEALGFASELQRNYISLLELGQHQPTLLVLFKLSHALGKSAAELVSEVENEFQQKPSKP